jgi:pimeloyl-ACP methyl ester carboxylesterase
MGEQVGISGCRGYAMGEHGQVHYRMWGDGVPLLLVHQAPMSHRQYERVSPLLAARGLRPIAIDLPGYGQSDPPGFVPEIADYASAPLAVMDALGISSASLLGHHTGSLVVTETALRHAARVERLILNGPLPLSDAARRKGLDYVETKEKGFAAVPDGSHLSEAFRNRMSYANPDTDWRLASRYIGEMLTASGPFWYGHHAAFHYDHAESLARIAHPTLILTNSGDEIYALALESHARRPDMALVVLQGGGIDIVDEQPEAWADAVAQFVRG